MHELTLDGVRYVPERTYPERGIPFNEVIKQVRQSCGFTLENAAKHIGVSKTYLWELESGAAKDPSFRVAISIARVYCLDLLYLSRTLSKE